MEKLVCPKCKSSLFKRWSVEDSPFAEWLCSVCGYSARELDSRPYTCWLCGGNTLVHLKDEAQDYWWCVDCLKQGVDPEFADKLDAMPLPVKQEYAAKCLNCYCEAVHIKDKSLHKLTDHLQSMGAYDDYSQWELISESLQQKIRETDSDTLNKLLENCLEVGRSDSDKEKTVWPAHHLRACVEILLKENIKPPPILSSSF